MNNYTKTGIGILGSLWLALFVSALNAGLDIFVPFLGLTAFAVGYGLILIGFGK